MSKLMFPFPALPAPDADALLAKEDAATRGRYDDLTETYPQSSPYLRILVARFESKTEFAKHYAPALNQMNDEAGHNNLRGGAAFISGIQGFINIQFVGSSSKKSATNLYARFRAILAKEIGVENELMFPDQERETIIQNTYAQLAAGRDAFTHPEIESLLADSTSHIQRNFLFLKGYYNKCQSDYVLLFVAQHTPFVLSTQITGVTYCAENIFLGSRNYFFDLLAGASDHFYVGMIATYLMPIAQYFGKTADQIFPLEQLETVRKPKISPSTLPPVLAELTVRGTKGRKPECIASKRNPLNFEQALYRVSRWQAAQNCLSHSWKRFLAIVALRTSYDSRFLLPDNFAIQKMAKNAKLPFNLDAYIEFLSGNPLPKTGNQHHPLFDTLAALIGENYTGAELARECDLAHAARNFAAQRNAATGKTQLSRAATGAKPAQPATPKND